ncbi:MAG: hypothetical protein BWZ08_00145 [candidate division BRC1 bacterium ADurb.BinA292]|nr:MAG: hypothetical protein BWZ08_00145 [candidate division BRC1 bacterium ADurb.BinA292]
MLTPRPSTWARRHAPPAPVRRLRRWMPLLTLLLAIALLSRVALAEGDWPMERAGLHRANRAKVAGWERPDWNSAA